MTIDLIFSASSIDNGYMRKIAWWAWRIVLYGVYTGVAWFVYNWLFSQSSISPGLGALAIVIGALTKDIVDELYKESGIIRSIYMVVEHNPFNFVLLAGILVTGEYTISPPWLMWLVVAIAGIDLLFDLSQDFRIELGRS